MGFRICYLAARLPPEQFVEALSLSVSGTVHEQPHGDWWTAFLTESNWSIIWCEDESFGSRSAETISEISKRSDVIHCQVNETVMWSSSEYWSAGKVLWRVAHDGSGDDKFNLTAEGELPRDFEKIREQHTYDQRTDSEDCDHMFEIPLELARSFLSFRHENILTSVNVDEFYILAPPRRTSILSRLFMNKK